MPGTDDIKGTFRVTGEFNADHGVNIKEGGSINWDSGDAMLIQSGAQLRLTGRNSAEASLLTTGSVLSSSPRAGIGYATGAGGTVGQAGGKNREVTLHTVTGRITLDNEMLPAFTRTAFNLSNVTIGLNDFVLVSHVSGGTLGGYVLAASPSYGEALINVYNATPNDLAEEIVIAFVVIKAAVA